MRAVKLDPTFSDAMDRLSAAVSMVSDGFARQDDLRVQQGYRQFDAAVEDAVTALAAPML